MRSGLLVLSVLAIFLAPSWSLAQVYRWVDPQGRVHYSEGLDSVPSQFRSTAKPMDFPKSPPPAPEPPESEKKPATSGEPGAKPAGDKPATPPAPEKPKGPAG
ncbi:MAG: DUF4124 domain-containing protein [Candidatus Rokubacteria bacterium]|nr:DUF4124 domain-containing protein [Candidatus Rokubacteria bacterium]